MNPREQMYEQVAGNACPKGPVIPPPEKLLRIIGLLGNAGDIAVPINRHGRSVRRLGIFPGAKSALPVKGSFDTSQFTDFSGLIQLFRLRISDAAYPLTPYLHDLFSVTPGGNKRKPFL